MRKREEGRKEGKKKCISLGERERASERVDRACISSEMVGREGEREDSLASSCSSLGNFSLRTNYSWCFRQKFATTGRRTPLARPPLIWALRGRRQGLGFGFGVITPVILAPISGGKSIQRYTYVTARFNSNSNLSRVGCCSRKCGASVRVRAFVLSID